MQIVAGIAIYLISLSIILVPDRFVKPMMTVGMAALITGVAAFVLLFFGPKDFATTHPALGRIFNPTGHALFYGFGLLCGVGMTMGFGVRKMLAAHRRRLWNRSQKQRSQKQL